MLYEIFDEVIKEQEDEDPAYEKALDTLLKFIKNNKYNKFPNAVKHNSSTSKTIVITNAGGRPDRDRLIKDMARQGMVTPNNQDKKDTLWFYKGEIDGFKFELRRGASKTTAPTATEFEEFLAAAADPDPAKADALKETYAKYGPEVIKTYLDLAEAMIKDTAIKGKKVEKTSGKGKYQLTDVYLKHDVRSGEPKTDIKADNDRVSVKRKGASQYASAQPKEFSAMVDYVLGKRKDVERIRKFAISVIKENLNKEKFYELRNNKDKYECKTDCDKQLTSYLLTVPQDNKEWFQELKNFVELQGGKISENVLGKYQEIFSNESFKQKLLHEAMTGEGKFGSESPATADHLLEWDVKNPANTSYEKITPELIKNKLKFTKFRIADRGNGRGGCLRIDAMAKPVNELMATTYEPTTVDVEKPTDKEEFPELNSYLEAYFKIAISEIEKQISKMSGVDMLKFFGTDIIFENEREEPRDLIDPEED